MRVLSRQLSWLVALMLVAGCPGPSAAPTGVDDKRLAVAKSEPLVALDKQPAAQAGFRNSDRSAPQRGSVDANLTDEAAAAQDPDTAARAKTREFIEQLRGGGWTVYLAACIPPRPKGSPAPDKDAIPAVQFDDGWTFIAYGYKLVDGVSYFASLEGHGSSGNRRVRVNLHILVPQSTEPTADLFPDRPPALAANATCLESAQPPSQRAVSGPAIEVDSDGPHPDGTPKPAGHR